MCVRVCVCDREGGRRGRGDFLNFQKWKGGGRLPKMWEKAAFEIEGS